MIDNRGGGTVPLADESDMQPHTTKQAKSHRMVAHRHRQTRSRRTGGQELPICSVSGRMNCWRLEQKQKALTVTSATPKVLGYSVAK